MEAIQLKKNVLWRAIDNEIIILELDQGNFFRLNGTGAYFLKLISEGHNTDAAVDEMVEKFKTPKSSVEKDVEAFIGSMKAFGVL